MIPIGAYATLGDTLLTAARRAPRAAAVRTRHRRCRRMLIGAVIRQASSPVS